MPARKTSRESTPGSLRTRIQKFIDKRFYRARYDAEKALAEFPAAARDEVDMDTLTGRLLTVVSETVQPEDVQLLLNVSGSRD